MHPLNSLPHLLKNFDQHFATPAFGVQGFLEPVLFILNLPSDPVAAVELLDELNG
jgi:hypothetical protein